jgi:hypothetical protein
MPGLSGLVRRAIVPALASILLVSSASSARADDATSGPDEVTLRGGAVVRGTVVLERRGVSVKIVEVGHKRARTIPWSRVAEVARGRYAPKTVAAHEAPPASEPAPQVPAAPPPPPSLPANAVRVHIDSPMPALLYSHEQASGTLDGRNYILDRATPVCAAPCDKEVDAAADHTFTTSGDFGTSPRFSLAGHQGDVELSVRPGNRTVHTTGLVLTIGGGVVAVLGGALAITGAALGASNITVNGKPTDGATFASQAWLVPAGLGVTGAGVAMVVAGVVALVTNKTSVDLHPMEGAGAKGEAKARYWLGEF